MDRTAWRGYRVALRRGNDTVEIWSALVCYQDAAGGGISWDWRVVAVPATRDGVELWSALDIGSTFYNKKEEDIDDDDDDEDVDDDNYVEQS